MMFERRGSAQSQADGQADAALNLAKRPRPDLALAVMFAGYRDAYLATYKSAYAAQRRAEERKQAEKLTRTASKNAKTPKTQTDRIFEQGWKGGFDGRCGTTWRLSERDKAIYLRGSTLGCRHKDYERADQLRQKSRHQNFQRSQGKSR